MNGHWIHDRASGQKKVCIDGCRREPSRICNCIDGKHEVKGHWDIGNLVGEWKLCVDFSHLPGRNCDEIGETPHHRFVPDASEVAETITRNVGETPLHARNVGETPSTTKRDSIMEEWIKFGWDELTVKIANQREQLTGMNDMAKRHKEEIISHRGRIKHLEIKIANQREQLTGMNDMAKRHKEEIISHRGRIKHLEIKIADQKEELARLNEQIKIDRWHIDSLDRIILARNAKLADLESAKKEPLATSTGLIAELEKRIAKYENSISNNLDKRYWMGVVAAFNDMLDLAKRHALIDEKAVRKDERAGYCGNVFSHYRGRPESDV
jgi:uncharacterized coiled-coil protein SlyX